MVKATNYVEIKHANLVGIANPSESRNLSMDLTSNVYDFDSIS